MYNNNQNQPNPYNYPPGQYPAANQNQYINPDAYMQANNPQYNNNMPPYQNQNIPPPPYQQPPYQQPPPPNTQYTNEQLIYVQVPIQPQVVIENRITSREPQSYYCPYCLTNVVTQVKYEPGDKTSLMACLLCCVGGVICCLIPYCVDDCQDAIHICPICKSSLGKIPF